MKGRDINCATRERFYIARLKAPQMMGCSYDIPKIDFWIYVTVRPLIVQPAGENVYLQILQYFQLE